MPSLDGKPILASWMGGAEVAAGESILNRARIPTFPFPDTAVRAFTYMWRWAYNLRASTKRRRCRKIRPSIRPISRSLTQIIQKARGAGRTILTESESKQVLEAYGVPAVETAGSRQRRGGR